MPFLVSQIKNNPLWLFHLRRRYILLSKSLKKTKSPTKANLIYSTVNSYSKSKD